MVGERAQARGLGAPTGRTTGRLEEVGAYWARAAIASGFQELGERSASTPMRLQNGEPWM
eukprot:4818620-Pleurochrysis_carterae.AAC.1